MIDLLQWPAMAITVLASYFVASSSEHRREIGFWGYLLSNVLWVVWGWSDDAYALVVLQFVLAAMNIRGVRKNERGAKGDVSGDDAARGHST